MLRFFVLVLLVANLLLWGWSRGALSELGFDPPSQQADPGRMARQVHPEAVRIEAFPPPAAATPQAPGAAHEPAHEPADPAAGTAARPAGAPAS